MLASSSIAYFISSFVLQKWGAILITGNSHIFDYNHVTPRNGKYSDEALKNKLLFEENFFKLQLAKKPPTYVLVETVGHALPCFRHGTDYILNLFEGPSAFYTKYKFTIMVGFRILVLPDRQPISRQMAVGLLHIPLGIALLLYL